MPLQQLIYFREVAQTRNFTKASRNLHVTQSALNYLAQMEGLETVPFAQQQLYAALPPGHPLADREVLRVSDLADEPLIGYHRGRNLDQWISRMFESEGLRPNTIEYTDDWSAQITKVSVGEGISLMQMIPSPENSVLFVPLAGEMTVRTIYMMWASDRKLSDAAEFARDFFLDYRHEIGTI